jgi:hypothetical protein
MEHMAHPALVFMVGHACQPPEVRFWGVFGGFLIGKSTFLRGFGSKNGRKWPEIEVFYM